MPYLFNIVDSTGAPVTSGWVVQQAHPQAYCIDQAHRGLGVWCLPAGTPEGQAKVVTEAAWRDQPAVTSVISWTPRQRTIVEE